MLLSQIKVLKMLVNNQLSEKVSLFSAEGHIFINLCDDYTKYEHLVL